MNDFGLLELDKIGTQEKPGQSAAVRALAERRTLPSNALLPGAYYRGYLGNASTIARWNGQRSRFVAWEHDKGQPRLKGARHVAEARPGEGFAPLERVEADNEYHISDFALATTG